MIQSLDLVLITFGICLIKKGKLPHSECVHLLKVHSIHKNKVGDLLSLLRIRISATEMSENYLNTSKWPSFLTMTIENPISSIKGSNHTAISIEMKFCSYESE